MSGCPPTPVVRRRVQRLASHPYMPFKTDFRASTPNDSFSEGPTTFKYPSFRRAVSIGRSAHHSPSLKSRTPRLPLETIQETLTMSVPVPSTPSTIRPVALESIEEYDLEDYEEDGCPPISSSPGRSSDPFFPFDDALSSPQTSPGAHDKTAPPERGEFSSRLHALLAVAAQQREKHEEIDNDLAAERSLSVTPDYRSSLTPRNGNDTFGPRRTDSTAIIESCHCSDCATSRTASVASYSGYSADLGSSPARAPQASSQSRAHSKRSYSSLHDDTTPTTRSKKSKPLSRSSSFFSRSTAETSDDTSLSRVPASLRKSLSLQSNRTASPFHGDTAPNTPCPKTSGRLIDPGLRAIPFDVPIIAPPPEHIARLPLGKETLAKIRIGNFLAREELLRAADKLDSMTVAAAVSSMNSGPDGDEEARELERLKWELILGIGPEFRRLIVGWILEVLPKKSTYIAPPPRISTASHQLARAASDSTSSSFSSLEMADFGDKGMPDLIDQLLHSPETRFHAAHMFTRFFYLVMRDSRQRTKIEAMQQAAEAAENDLPFDPAVPAEGWHLVAWDSCLACLALSVKLHRDVLEPLNPVLSWEFEALAPHELSFQDLEIAQEDVLVAFGHRLGGTPQPILDELWIALPSLQQLLGFKNGWRFAQKEAWWRLFDAVAAPDVLKFPISLLTVAALAEALVAALVSKYDYDATVDSQVTRRRPSKLKVLERLQSKAEKEMEGVIQDIQAVIGISDQQLRACRSWIRASLKDN
ncbi:hypothetical protein DFH06DRAFT_1073089 [Mycena polygramma]|nr:hypothetical protein DFH06DRAFT_1073089 [Mycena polygramma]